MLQSSIEMEIECHELTNQPPPKEIEACRMITYIQLLTVTLTMLSFSCREIKRESVSKKSFIFCFDEHVKVGIWQLCIVAELDHAKAKLTRPFSQWVMDCDCIKKKQFTCSPVTQSIAQ